MSTVQQPKAYIARADKLFDQSRKLTNDSTRDFLQNFIVAYAAWIERTLAGK